MTLLWAVLLASGTALAADAPPANPLADELLTGGLPIAGGPTYKFPPPLLKSGMDKAALDAALAKAADKLPLELFLRRSDQAPFTLKIDSINDQGGTRRGIAMDLWFVAHGKATALQEKDIIQSLLTGDRKDAGNQKVEWLTPDQLATRRIKPQEGQNREDRFATFNLMLLDKVLVTGVTRNVRTWSGPTQLSATALDERFAADAQFPNRWRSVTRQADKADQLGPPQPYAGFAGYATIVQLPEMNDALLVEMHFAFHEPPEWFGGPNLLRSKLPVVIQENVRTLRRKLARD